MAPPMPDKNNDPDHSDRKEQDASPKDNVTPKRTSKITLKTISPITKSTRLTLHSTSITPARVPLPPSPTKTGQSSASSIRLRSTQIPPKRPSWISPSANDKVDTRGRVPRNRATSSKLSVTTPERKATRRYPLALLLALRPPQPCFLQLRTALTLSDQSRHSKDSSNEYATAPRRGRTLFSAQTRYPMSYMNTSYAKIQENSQTAGDLHSMPPLRYVHEPGEQDTPTRQSTVIRKRTCESIEANDFNVSWKQGEEGDANQENIVSKIRSVLNDQNRKYLRSSRKSQSVKWDPALIENDPTVVSSHTSQNYDLKLSERKSKSSETCQDAHILDLPSSNRPKKRDVDKSVEYMKSITELKKGDRRKLQQLLQALRNIDSDDSSDNDTVIIRRPQRPRPASKTIPKQTLNPQAPVFKAPSFPPTYLDVSSHVSEGSSSLNVPRKRPHVDENRHPEEPIWVRMDQIPKAKRQSFHDGQHPNMQRTWVNETTKFPLYAEPLIPEPYVCPPIQYHPQIPYPPMVLPTGLYPYGPIIPPIFQAPEPCYKPQPPVFKKRPRINPKLPVINLATGRIPSENEHGREALVQNILPFVLDNFVKKYPLTGKLKAASPATVQGRHATAIQQRLEYLLLEQKEKKAREKSLGYGDVKANSTKQQKDPYETGKELLQKLYGNMDAKEVKIATVEKRSSETSTCVDSEDLESGQ